MKAFAHGIALILLAAASPAMAEDSDDVFVDRMRAHIVDARSDAHVAVHGRFELDRAERALRDLHRSLDDNERLEARSITSEIDALVATARLRAQIADRERQLATASARLQQANFSSSSATKFRRQARTTRPRCACRR